MQFLYFIENCPTRVLNLSKGEARELGRVLSSPASAFCPDGNRSPSGAVGLFVAQDDPSMVGKIKYMPKAQEWMPWGTCTFGPEDRRVECAVHVGIWNDAPPAPENLIRKSEHLLDGIRVQLGGGGWVLPRLVVPTGQGAAESALPTTVVRVDGKIESRPMRRWRELHSRAEAMWKSLWWEIDSARRAREGEEPESAPVGLMSADDRAALVMDALAINYRVTDAELALLEVVTSANLPDALVALASIDLSSAINRALEKKTEELQTTSSPERSRGRAD